MKIIHNVSIILLNTSFLIAQADATIHDRSSKKQGENKLEVKDCGLERFKSQDSGNGGQGTNQVIDCRLKDRLKAANQVIGYRLQVAGLETTELFSENQIGQRAKLTTNYEPPTTNGDNSAESLNCHLIEQGGKTTTNHELRTTNHELRTTNCNNSRTDLNCYLMMDPSELKNIEEEAEFLEELLEIFGKNEIEAKDGFQSKVEEHPKKTKKTVIGNGGMTVVSLPIETQEVIQESSASLSEVAEYSSNVFKPIDEGKHRIVLWVGASPIVIHAAEQMSKLIESESEGTLESAKAWRDSVTFLSCEHYGHADLVRALEKVDEGDAWYDAGLSAANAAEQMDKAIEAEAAGNIKIAKAWRGAVQQNQLAYKHYTHAARVYASDKTREGNSWYNAGWSSFCAAEQMGKSIEAEIEENPEVAHEWKEAIKQNQLAMKHFTSAAIANASQYEKDEGKIWDGAGAAALKSAQQIGKAIEAKVFENSEIAALWKESAKQSQLAYEYYNRAFIAIVSKKWYESNSWRDAGRVAMEAAEQMDKVIEAEVSGKRELAESWRESIKQNHLASEYYAHAATAHNASGEDYDDGSKDKVGAMWDNAGNAALEAAQQIEKAIEAKIAGASTGGEKWSETLKQNQLACEYYIHAAIAYA